MSRRRVIQKRQLDPDPRFGDRTVTKFVNYMMLRGKKSTAEGIVYGALEIISQRGSDDPLDVFLKAVSNTSPIVETKSRRVGGSTYQVPMEVSSRRRLALALRWLRDNARDRAGKSMAEKLAGELMDAAANRGGAVRKKEDVHRMAEANKAFSHYRW